MPQTAKKARPQNGPINSKPYLTFGLPLSRLGIAQAGLALLSLLHQFKLFSIYLIINTLQTVSKTWATEVKWPQFGYICQIWSDFRKRGKIGCKFIFNSEFRLCIILIFSILRLYSRILGYWRQFNSFWNISSYEIYILTMKLAKCLSVC